AHPGLHPSSQAISSFERNLSRKMRLSAPGQTGERVKSRQQKDSRKQRIGRASLEAATEYTRQRIAFLCPEIFPHQGWQQWNSPTGPRGGGRKYGDGGGLENGKHFHYAI